MADDQNIEQPNELAFPLSARFISPVFIPGSIYRVKSFSHTMIKPVETVAKADAEWHRVGRVRWPR